MTARGFVVPETGLTARQAADRLAADGPNELPVEAPRSLLRQAFDVAREPMLLLLLVAGSVNFAVAEPIDGVTLLAFVLVVIGISIVQEHRTESAITALRDLSSPRALVMRDGTATRIAGREVVRGDLVLLAEGDRVPADIVLIDAANFTVDESTLTGESMPVRKRASAPSDQRDGVGAPGGDNTPWAFSGTLVVKGHAVGVAAATGPRTVLGGIGTALTATVPERTGLQHEVDAIVRVVSVVAAAVAIAVVVAFGATRHQWLEGVLAGVATAMAMLPEEFPVVLTVFLALGAWRMSKHHVLTRRPAVIEALGAATVICVDKTGTLTENRMTVAALALDHWVELGHDDALPHHLHPLAEYAALASPIDPFDPTDTAFRVLADQRLQHTEHLHPEWTLAREYPLSDELLALSHVWQAPGTSALVIAAKGAPEAIADLCHLDGEAIERLMALVGTAAERGYRVLAIAVAQAESSVPLPTDQHDFAFELMGLAALHDPVRPSAVAAVAECRTAGIRTVMITGDNPTTALAIAREVGLANTMSCVSGSAFAAMSEQERHHAAATVDVFARMVPEQKLHLVQALRSAGHVVAMTGDGVNDAPAVRAADIGIAMGQRGTDVAREAAALVITDDDFTSIAAGVRLGRGIYDNARKAMAYIVAVHVPIVGMSLLPLVVRSWPVVLLPTQIAFLELIIDPACSVVFEAEQIDPQIMQHQPRSRSDRLFDRTSIMLSSLQGVAVMAASMVAYLWGIGQHLEPASIRSLTFTTLVLSNLGLIVVNRSWRLSWYRTMRERHNPALGWIMVGAVTLLAALLVAAPLRRVFRLGELSLQALGVSLCATVGGLVWFEVWKWHRRRTVLHP